MTVIIQLIVNAFAVFVTARLLPGVHIDGYWTAAVVAIVLGILNTMLKPALILLTLPVTIVTLGLWLLVLNALLIELASALVSGFHVDGFGWAFLFGIVLALINSFLHSWEGKFDADHYLR
jgi:putative membrane protein